MPELLNNSQVNTVAIPSAAQPVVQRQRQQPQQAQPQQPVSPFKTQPGPPIILLPHEQAQQQPIQSMRSRVREAIKTQRAETAIRMGASADDVQQLLAALHENPQDRGIRGILADAMDEQGRGHEAAALRSAFQTVVRPYGEGHKLYVMRAFNRTLAGSDHMMFSAETPPELAAAIITAHSNGSRVHISYGDPETGRDSLDEFDTHGTIGRSTGTQKIPLLIKTRRSMGGGGIMDDRIVRMRDYPSGRLIYQHPTYHHGKIEVRPLDPMMFSNGRGRLPLTHEVLTDGSTHARFTSERAANMWVRKMGLSPETEQPWSDPREGHSTERMSKGQPIQLAKPFTGWISPEGQMHPLNEDEHHATWANRYLGLPAESYDGFNQLHKSGWLRVSGLGRFGDKHHISTNSLRPQPVRRNLMRFLGTLPGHEKVAIGADDQPGVVAKPAEEAIHSLHSYDPRVHLMSKDGEPVKMASPDDHRAMLRSVLAAPADSAPKLVWADMIDEDGMNHTAAALRRMVHWVNDGDLTGPSRVGSSWLGGSTFVHSKIPGLAAWIREYKYPNGGGPGVYNHRFSIGWYGNHLMQEPQYHELGEEWTDDPHAVAGIMAESHPNTSGAGSRTHAEMQEIVENRIRELGQQSQLQREGQAEKFAVRAPKGGFLWRGIFLAGGEILPSEADPTKHPPAQANPSPPKTPRRDRLKVFLKNRQR